MVRSELLTSRDTLDTSTTGKTADGGLGDALDVVAQNLAMTLGSALSETFASLSTYDSTLASCLIVSR